MLSKSSTPSETFFNVRSISAKQKAYQQVVMYSYKLYITLQFPCRHGERQKSGLGEIDKLLKLGMAWLLERVVGIVWFGVC